MYPTAEFYDAEGGAEVQGEDVLGHLAAAGVGEDVLGAVARAIKKAVPKRQAITMARQAKPPWRGRMALGVPEPGYGLWPLPFTPLAGGGVFTAALTNIQYRVIAQNPFRGERLVTDVRRTGAAGVQVFAQNGIFIGTRPQQGALGALPLETYGPNAFDMRLVMQQAEQGAELNIFAFVNPAPAVGDTLALGIQILGRVVN